MPSEKDPAARRATATCGACKIGSDRRLTLQINYGVTGEVSAITLGTLVAWTGVDP